MTLGHFHQNFLTSRIISISIMLSKGSTRWVHLHDGSNVILFLILWLRSSGNDRESESGNCSQQATKQRSLNYTWQSSMAGILEDKRRDLNWKSSRRVEWWTLRSSIHLISFQQKESARAFREVRARYLCNEAPRRTWFIYSHQF